MQIEKDKQKLRSYVGHLSQVCGTKDYQLSSGKMKGVKAIDVNVGSGLKFTVLPDRGMDLGWADFKGIPLAYISKTGIVAPEYYDQIGNGFLKSFHCGLLTTCGLTQMGAACEDGDEALGIHGTVSHIPAEHVQTVEEWIDDALNIQVKGMVRESEVFGKNITLSRTYATTLGENKILITDHIENCGFEKQPFMLLYHFNLGYPLLSEASQLYINSSSVKGRDEEADRGITEWMKFQKPTSGFKEQVFYHDVSDNKEKIACLYHSKIENGLGFYIKSSSNVLDHLIQWKMMGQGDYVLGIEPATWTVEGRRAAREQNELKYIESGEIIEIQIELGIVEGCYELEALFK